MRSVTQSVTPRMGLFVTTIGRIWAYLTRCCFKWDLLKQIARFREQEVAKREEYYGY